MKSCFFMGHREAPESLSAFLAEAIERHITELGVAEFVVGSYGAFDRLAARQLSLAKKRHPHIHLLLLTPYHPSQRKVLLPEGFEASYVIADTSRAEDAKVIVETALERYGTVDILVNNAGMLSMASLQNVTLDEWEKVFNVNVTSALVLAQSVAPLMKEKGKGVIVNIASVASFAAHHGYAAYISSKHAMAGLSKSMAWELGPEIRVNAIAPGAIHTAMVDSIGGPAVLQGMIDNCPLKRIGQPQDIANVALFLASDDSSFVNGQVIKVDGGFEA